MAETVSGYYFPDQADGWHWQWDLRMSAPVFKTEVQTTESGREIRRKRYPAGGYRGSSGSVKALTPAFGQILRDFFIARNGMYQNFYLMLPNGAQYAGISVGTGDGATKCFVIPYAEVTFSTVYDAGSATSAYTSAIITKAEILGGAGTFAITAGSNDVLRISINGAAYFNVTLTAGATQTAANVAADLNGNGSFSAVATADASIDGKLRIQTNTTGRLGSVEIDGTVTHTAHTVLGLDATRPYYTGQEVRITFTSGPANGHALTADLSSARARMLARFNTDALPEAFLPSAVNMETYGPLPLKEVI